jgi:hypothetical protein
MILKKQIQPARAIRIQALGHYRDVILAPFAVLVQLTSVAIGEIKLEAHSNPAVGFFGHVDGITTACRLSVATKDAIDGSRGCLSHGRNRNQEANHTSSDPYLQGAGIAMHQSLQPTNRSDQSQIRGNIRDSMYTLRDLLLNSKLSSTAQSRLVPGIFLP